MLGWMILPFRRYVDFLGRSRRREFWTYALFVWLVYALLFFVFVGSGISLGAFVDDSEHSMFDVLPLVFSGAGMLMALWWLVTLLPSLAVTARRLHDRDLSGWWVLGVWIASVIPLINLLVWLALFVVLVLPGTPGANRYGPDPRDPTGADIFA